MDDLGVPSRKLTYPTWGKGKSSPNMSYQGVMLIPWRVPLSWGNTQMAYSVQTTIPSSQTASSNCSPATCSDLEGDPALGLTG